MSNTPSDELKFSGLSRCGKSCRLRWMNYLRPNIKRGNYSKEEEDIIIKLHKEMGNRYALLTFNFSAKFNFHEPDDRIGLYDIFLLSEVS